MEHVAAEPADDRAAPPAHVGWRLLALVYDALPVLAIWIAASAVAYLLNGARPLVPGTAASAALFVAIWALTGAYAVLSWRRGGQTLGMRAWRIAVRGDGGRRPSMAALWLRYALASVGTAAAGLGLLWCLVDRHRRAWHDLAAGTVVVRVAPAPRRR